MLIFLHGILSRSPHCTGKFVLSLHVCRHALTAMHSQIAYDAINFQTKYDSDRKC